MASEATSDDLASASSPLWTRRGFLKQVLGLSLSSSFIRAEEEVETARLFLSDAIEHCYEVAYVARSKDFIYQKLLEATSEILRQPLDPTFKPTEIADFFQLFEQIHRQSQTPKSLLHIAEQSLSRYCSQLDSYSKYYKASDYKLVQLLSRSRGSGIGMSLQEKKGQFFCFPLPDSTAAEAGIKANDELLEVNGHPIKGLSIESIASLVRGTPNTEVELRVQHPFGRAEKIKVRREPLQFPACSFEKKLTGHFLRVRKFTSSLLTEIDQHFKSIDRWSTLTIDLRGCPGGDLDVAVKFASLFLKKDSPIVTLKSRHRNDETLVSENESPYSPKGIVILQDSGTASGSELVIAALMADLGLKVVTEGEKSYGKGVMQERFELNSGGALQLTTHLLVAPQGKSWDQIGLLPSLQNHGRIFKT